MSFFKAILYERLYNFEHQIHKCGFVYFPLQYNCQQQSGKVRAATWRLAVCQRGKLHPQRPRLAPLPIEIGQVCWAGGAFLVEGGLT